ncbi:low-affinity phosphate transporter PitH [Enteractinococcus fodinae]|uniref:PiT family inorganic phosphate transporter n=1 Tax=Enteractinococcus fodinae TaxID=684663 RepID=A0ABU2B6T9_9MICC|nr:inorganic phosphate transporter [Enteractinococcus fodinae]MDR7348099.1 PiT family inorganic phosphate transporter [Enteractinococcus fodinae]
MGTFLLLAAVLILTAAFSFVVAGRDTPNAVALPIAAGALTPGTALSMTAVMRVVGAIMGVGSIQFFAAGFVALVPEGDIGLVVTAIGVAVALAWALFTWWKGVLVSSSHALTAAITGGAVAVSVLGAGHLIVDDLSPVAINLALSLIASPVLAVLLAWVVAIPLTWLTKNVAPHRVAYSSRGTLAITAAANALGHGVQYGQRLYIVALMSVTAAGADAIPHWALAWTIIVLLGLGTFVTAWRVNYTLTRRITVLDPMHSAIASSTSALLLLVGSFMLHIPLSSSITTVAAITGAGTAQNSGAVRWAQVLRLMTYFLMTVIVCAALGFGLLSLVMTQL